MDGSTLPSVSDEDLQAQAWLPTVMSALLRHADKASASLAELESGGPPSSAQHTSLHRRAWRARLPSASMNCSQEGCCSCPIACILDFPC